MEVLLERQAEIVSSAQRIITNFKKDSSSRKTSKYLKTRIEALENLWGEYDANNTILEQEQTKTHPYFKEDDYNNFQVLCVQGLQLIKNTKPCDENNDERSNGDEESTSGSTNTNKENKSSPSLSDELLSQQKTNFRAFNRVVNNIDIETLNEQWEIKDKLEMLQSRWKAVDELHWKIDNLLEGDDKQYERDFSKQEQTYENIKTELNRKLNSVKHQQDTTPHIELPTFSGNYTNWPAFSDLYVEAIHNNPTLNKCQKMQHLKGKLKGEAERLVQHLTISTENYDTCWELLNRRYNNIQLLFTKLMQTFMNQPSMQKHTAFEIKRLHDISIETVNAIHNLGVNTSTWDPILVHIMTEKMDTDTYTAYMDARKDKRNLPSFDELINILESKFTALEPLSRKNKQPKSAAPPVKENEHKHKESSNDSRFKYAKTYKTTSERICPLCKTNEHVLLTCKRFLNMTPDAKVNMIKTLPVCENCLFYHKYSCNSKNKCKICNRPHHTVLHDVLCDTAVTKPSTSSPSANTSHKANHVAGSYDEVLLSTIELMVLARDGTQLKMRCLLDQGSQINLITEEAVQRLGLERCNQNASVFGIGTTANYSKGTVQLICESRYNNYTFLTDALVMSKVIGHLPNYTFEKQPWPHLHNINLADPDYNISRPVDILLDAKVYAEIIMDGILRGTNSAPIAQQTRLGWILVGNVKTFNCHAVLNNLEDISQYWELEEITEHNSNMTPAEEYCETLFQTTTTRRSDGRYEVKLPMKPNFEEHLMPSKPQAVAQFKQLERRFARDASLSENYKQFIAEYEQLGHMKPCSKPREPSCYLPHHGVIKLDSLTTKLRTVFNASCKLRTGYSLNDLMEGGPNLQKDLQAMILLWRTFEFVYTADIEKFYRQILVKEEDQHLQKIVWRNSTSDPITDYQLCTVTYGTKAAPYLAMRTIKQLVQDDGHMYPLATNILNSQLYVDDLLGGSNNINEALQAQQQLINILQGGGFKLRKWASNNEKLLEHLPNELISQNMIDFKHAETNKTLGLSWNPRTDQFTFLGVVQACDKVESPTTKRTLLSKISKIFDPLGWLSPVTIKGKILFQRVWTMNLTWDDDLPHEIQQEWNTFEQDLHNIAEMKIKRWMGNMNKPIELHGFCDASEKAYGCVLYCKSVGHDEQPVIQLVAGKTKLAPLNKPMSLPRLELCGALLLSKLMKKVIDITTEQTGTITMHGWTDSKVVLGWLLGDIGRWKTFVANRVAEIKNILPSSCLKHVRSEENPADCASRGLLPSQLQSHPLWWEGPIWLKNTNIPEQPKITCVPVPEEEKKPKVCHTSIPPTSIVESLLENHSSMNKAIRIFAWISRFIHNIRNKDNRTTLNLKANEIRRAHDSIIRAVQTKHFNRDIEQLLNNNRLHRKSQLLNLNPWIDDEGILRVGGRLENSNLRTLHKHPMIVPSNDRLSILLIDWAHKMTLHGGARLTLTFLRNNYWMLGGMSAVKRELQKCIKCIRFKASSRQQIMADLPRPRVTPSRPFTHTGVDLAGPVDVKSNKGRGIATTKGYIVIFICLSTKAVHIELASDQSSITFLAAFKRLCARRGTPKKMYSDCGTNFVGAARSLEREHKQALEQYSAGPELMEHLTNGGVEWHFNAPSWPTAGGLWEAAVKQTKHHLKRVLGEQKLTFEEFTTLLTQIEACLNSRPLVALSDSIEDLECLTPAHFLVGDQTLAPPLSQEVEEISLGTRWKLTEKMHKDFWRKWSTEYLQTLQTRSKWHYAGKDFQVGDLVIIKEDHVTPARWRLGRVVETHPGNDGRVRVVTLKTKINDGVKRPVSKLIRLPVETGTQHPQEQQPETETKQQINNKQQKKRQTRKKGFNLLNMVLLLLSMCAAVTGTQPQRTMEVTALNNNQPLYFDKVADMQVIQDEWKMVVYYNLSIYWHSLTNIEYHVNMLDDLCKDEPAFKSLTSQLRHEVTELQHYNSILSSEHGRRYRRGLIDGIGYVANSLFGVLDERFAAKYGEDIQAVQNNENHLLNLYKQQTSIIEGEYNIIKRNEEIMVKQFASISQQLSDLNNLVKEEQRKAMYITAATLTATLIIDNLRRLQKQLLDLVTDVRSGHLDAHLLTPEEFEYQLNVITAQIPNDITLPCISSQQDCIREMYKLSRVHVRLTDYLIFEVKLPLISTEPFELNRVIPTPIIRQQRMTIVKPTAKYSALNLRKDMIIPVNEDDVHTGCISFKQNKLLCRLSLPIHTTTKDLSTLCEAQIINNRHLSNCDTVESTCRDEWIMLHSRAEWLFTCCQKCAIRIFCTETNVKTETLYGIGILKISPGCMLKGDNIVIHSSKTYRTEMTLDKEDEIYFPESEANNVLKEINFTYVPETHEKQLHVLQSQINTVKATQKNLNMHNISHDVHHYTVYGLIGAIIIMILSIWAYCRWKRFGFQTKRNESTAQNMEMKKKETKLDLETTKGEPQNLERRNSERHSSRRVNRQTTTN